jgi:hypothetical protein
MKKGGKGPRAVHRRESQSNNDWYVVQIVLE